MATWAWPFRAAQKSGVSSEHYIFLGDFGGEVVLTVDVHVVWVGPVLEEEGDQVVETISRGHTQGRLLHVVFDVWIDPMQGEELPQRSGVAVLAALYSCNVFLRSKNCRDE